MFRGVGGRRPQRPGKARSCTICGWWRTSSKNTGCPSRNRKSSISIGTVGLVKAVDSFDCTKGARFATYASKCINNEILMNFRSQKKHADQIYMGEPIETDGDGNQLTLMDIIDDGTNLPEMVDTLIQSKQLYQYLERCLTPRETGDPGASLRTVRLRTHDPA